MAVSELAPQPVAFYAAVFFLVNATYICLIWQLVDRTSVDEVPARLRKTMRFRAIVTLCLFGAAAIVALKYPLVGLGICICCLIVYLRPEPPEVGIDYRRRQQVDLTRDEVLARALPALSKENFVDSESARFQELSPTIGRFSESAERMAASPSRTKDRQARHDERWPQPASADRSKQPIRVSTSFMCKPVVDAEAS
jgi:hypothetical protein